jgi:hypothetical protein
VHLAHGLQAPNIEIIQAHALASPLAAKQTSKESATSTLAWMMSASWSL